jgi:hypothetical protein
MSVNKSWACGQLGMPGQQVGLDRIFYEATATGGDLRVLGSAARYASIVDRAAPPAIVSWQQPISPRSSLSS